MKNPLHRSAVAGGLIWLVLMTCPLPPRLGMGPIEKLFLFGPLVIVPIGLALANVRDRRVEWLQPAGAGLVTLAFFLPQGWTSGVLTIPWLMMSGWVALEGWRRFQFANLCGSVPLLMLPVGAVGVLQSRWGMEPLGFREPLVLLVAVHFHFAAFVSPLVTGATLEGLKNKSRSLAVLVCAGSPVLASGYVLHLRALRLTGAMMLVVGLVITSILIAKQWRTIRPRLAQVLLAVAVLSVWAAMAYAAVYAVADYYGEVWVAIPQMARTHGVINALGFSLGGLVGWSLVQNNERKIQ